MAAQTTSFFFLLATCVLRALDGLKIGTEKFPGPDRPAIADVSAAAASSRLTQRDVEDV